ncbi:transmembrane protein 232 [Lamellibrachia satsuma]|nr:transmembrane protein 232 [Lamellibrachia satsuma]
MPILRVPVVHKFGIISHSQRVELQERLLKQTYLQTYGTERTQAVGHKLLEVNDEFIQQYNLTESFEEKERLENVASKMLERIKRKAGWTTGGVGDYVDLPLAWTELAQLAQCKGEVQEECLNVLITSLGHAPLNKGQIPALFFLAETTLYWLRTDAINQPILRTGEIKLLKMGFFVFLRMFYHHMAGQLKGRCEFKNRLYTYLDGFSENQEAYNPYPNALLCVRYISEVGMMIVGDCNTEAGEMKEGDNLKNTDNQDGEQERMHAALLYSYDDTQTTTDSAVISSSVHDLSPTLWHVLDVWRCVSSLSGGLQSALHALAICGSNLAVESWVDALCALQVLGDACKSDVRALHVLQSLARGLMPSLAAATPIPDGSTTGESYPDRDALSTSCKTKTEADTTVSKDFTGAETLSSKAQTYETTPETAKAMGRHKGCPFMKDIPKTDVGRLMWETHQFTKTSDLMRTEYSMKATVGRSKMSGISDSTSVPTYTNLPCPDLAGIQGWHWEVAITYTNILADICLHGITSGIQKLALVGTNRDTHEIHKLAKEAQWPMRSAGLVDLVYFHAVLEATDGGVNEWSWRVRYSALSNLVRICQYFLGDEEKVGLRMMAWRTLMKAQSLEKDHRVLEALTVGQVDASLETIVKKHVQSASSTLGAKIADGLSQLYLPPLPPAIPPPPMTKPLKKVVKVSHSTPRKHLRTSLREEIMLATALYEPPVDYRTRTSFDLMRIIEDQWRKEKQAELEHPEAEENTDNDTKKNEASKTDGKKTKVKDTPHSPLQGIRKKEKFVSGSSSHKKVTILAPGLKTAGLPPVVRAPPKKRVTVGVQ